MRAKPMRVTRAMVAVAAVGVLVNTVAACSHQSEPLLTWDKMNLEYQASTTTFPFDLPAGVVFPQQVWKPDNANKQLYALGFGEMQAYFFADCAYQRVAIANQVSNPASSMAALDMSGKVHSTPFFQAHVQDGDIAWADVLNKARLGDFSVLVGFYTTGCTGDWMEGKTG